MIVQGRSTLRNDPLRAIKTSGIVGRGLRIAIMVFMVVQAAVAKV